MQQHGEDRRDNDREDLERLLETPGPKHVEPEPEGPAPDFGADAPAAPATEPTLAEPADGQRQQADAGLEAAEAGPEPAIDPDSKELLDREVLDPPHEATRFDAGTGQGTVSGPPQGVEFQERPILDGSTLSPEAEASVPNPHRGQADPALMRRQPALNATSTNRWLFSAVVAAVVVITVQLLLARWNPLWCGVGVTVALVGLLAMLVVRATRMPMKPRLRTEAVLMAIIWLVPLAIIVSTLVGSRQEIWG